ncbi:MAG: nitroreductase family protein [Planctomycetota bacterium]|jgi:nitroreductase
MLKDLIATNRSYRRFDESCAIERDTLVELVDLARLSASGGNGQPLKFILSADAETNAAIFPNLAWAGFLKDWPGPAEGERPAGYILIFCDTEIAKYAGVDHGIAAQSMLLGAVEKGLGGCILGAINHDGLRAALDVDNRYEILLVIALGKPAETVQVEPMPPDGKTAYWRDDAGIHHVPKRSLDELIL